MSISTFSLIFYWKLSLLSWAVADQGFCLREAYLNRQLGFGGRAHPNFSYGFGGAPRIGFGSVSKYFNFQVSFGSGHTSDGGTAPNAICVGPPLVLLENQDLIRLSFLILHQQHPRPVSKTLVLRSSLFTCSILKELGHKGRYWSKAV